MNSLIYATSNPAKIASMQLTLSSLPLKIIGLKDLGITLPDVIENGNTPLENARIKAIAYYKILKRPLFSCDSGLYIDGLQATQQPGIHVRMVNGKRLNDEEMISYYSAIAKSAGGKVLAQYKNAICLVLNENEIYEYFGDDLGGESFYISSIPHHKRVEGFPLDCLSLNLDGKYYYDIINEDEIGTPEGFLHFFKNILIKQK